MKAFFVAVILLLFHLHTSEKPVIGYVSIAVAPEKIKMYWQHDGEIIGNFKRLKQLEPTLKFAMNGGMFTPAFGPVGLYVEKGEELSPLKIVNDSRVNFGLQPQGVFLIRNNKAEIVTANKYHAYGVEYATQSSPLLVINSKINPLLPDSKYFIRNGAGVLPDGSVLLAISKTEITFKEFAAFFISHHCTNALYLDGAISEAYTGQKNTSGNFGVMIGVLP